jgi:hypothetical protein
MRSGPRARVALATLTLGIGALACRAPTQVTLEIRTNADCQNPAAWKGVAIYAGRPGDDVESREPTLITETCDRGQVGTLTIVPSGARDEALGLRVVAGLSRKPEDCRAASYGGCIVARRAIRFEPGESLSVLIDLTTDCAGLACDATHSCSNGSCVESLGPALAVPPPDAGPSGPLVRCGDNAAQCPTSGDVCCVALNPDGSSRGACVAVKECPPTGLVLYCDDDSDCRAQAQGGDPADPDVCCVAGALSGYCNFGGGHASGTQCVPRSRCGARVVACEDRKPCANDGLCQLNAAQDGLPGYHTCCMPQ